MPSLPTSLSVVALVVAWLVVLVPMAARRREHVPESDDRSAGFRVLRRTSRRRNQRVLSRTAMAPSEADPDADELDGGVDSMDDPTLWSEDDDLERDEAGRGDRVLDNAEVDDQVDDADDDDPQVADEVGDDGVEDAEGAKDGADPELAADLAESLYDEDDDLDDFADDDELPQAVDPRGVRATRRADQPMAVPDVPARPAARTRIEEPRSPRQDGPAEWDAADEWTSEHPAARSPRSVTENSPAAHAGAAPRSDSSGSGDPGRIASHSDDLDAASLRPVPRRHGRGGFDPEAAAKARAFRYRRRRRVAVVLLLALVAFTLVSVFVMPAAWIGAVVSGALLVGYLAYLRRQVRIEESIRQRRTARLAQARQIRPEHARAGSRESRRQPDAAFGPAPAGYDSRYDDRYQAPTEMAPSAQYRTGTVVDLDDDDPAFSDLEYRQPLTYRRASGQ